MVKKRLALAVGTARLYLVKIFSCFHLKISCFQVPGFQSFIIETFATNCCLYSLLDNSFEFRDANTVRLIATVCNLIFTNFSCNYIPVRQLKCDQGWANFNP